jgi:UDP-N-acetylmuramoylalanine--D-glutamate ligase
MLDQIIKHQNINIWTGGNIGAGVLDVLENNLAPDLVLLELSSFQLELCQTFAPDLAIWTNFFPNHLDKHSNLQEYFMAKMQILAHQTTDQFALLPISLIDQLQPFIQTQITQKESPTAISTSNTNTSITNTSITNTSITNTSTTNPIQIKSKLYFFSENKPTKELIDKLRPQDALLYLDHNDQNTVIKLSQKQDASNNQQNYNTETIGSIEQIDKLAEFTFRENLLIIFGSLYIFSKIVNKTLALSDACSAKATDGMHKYTKNNITTSLAKLADTNAINFSEIDPLACQVEHRLEKVASINSIEFYNDSKATTISSTIAAVQKLASKNKPIILILGGLSKGVDRSPMISEIKKYVKLVISFGKEAEIIKNMCEQANLPCQSIEILDKLILEKSSPEQLVLGKLLLEQAVKASFLAAQLNDQILLSPSGSSYDLFKDYQERGRIFKQIVLGLTDKTTLKK